MRAIVGRFADLSLGELLRLLAAASASGELAVRTQEGSCQVKITGGMVEAKLSAPLLAAFHRREGSFTFRPGPVPAEGEWQPMEELLVRLARELPSQPSRAGDDALSELRESLAEVPFTATRRVLVLTADPRPYRGLEVEWQRKGWEVVLAGTPSWPGEGRFDVAVVHLPGSATLAGQGKLWLELLAQAQRQEPPVPVVWVGGLTDAWLRHQAVQLGAAFLLPAPMGEVGEAARWFREDLTAVVERLLQRPAEPATGMSWAFREFFLALHAETTPEETRASLLRLAARSFAKGLLLAVRENSLEVLGGFGFAPIPRRLPRGVAVLEGAVATGRQLEGGEVTEPVAGLVAPGERLWVFPLRHRQLTAGLLVATGPSGGGSTGELLSLLPGAAPLLGL
ncbi:MAG: DUF4388 domain-containing protein [Thermoanaerobaculum sp.]|nr:DUF4388 domain-containing protein [Thermoanaerobaculum sp.]MDW7968483.1 DUF4388 domain-containing protein [Thermoanaerobaculum sp.]